MNGEVEGVYFKGEFLLQDLRITEKETGHPTETLIFAPNFPIVVTMANELHKQSLSLYAEKVGRQFEELMSVALYYNGTIDMYRQALAFRDLDAAEVFIDQVLEPGMLAAAMARSEAV